MRLTTSTVTAGAASLTGFLSNATGATWTLTATSISVDSLAHLLTIKGDAATDHSAKTALITGTDENGVAQTETVNLPNGTATVTSTKYWLTVTSVVPSATIGADTVDIGWSATSVSPWLSVLGEKGGFNLGVGVTVVSGSPSYTLQHTYDRSEAFDHATVAAKTASFDGTYTSPVSEIRLKFTVAGVVTLNAVGSHM